MGETPMTLSIAVYSDVVCPWCHLGKKRLEEGLRLAGVTGAEITYLPYELNPHMPQEGMERTAYLDAKFGPGKRPAMEERLTEAGREDGVAFNWAAMTKSPNTRKAHILIALATGAGTGPALKGALMTAYFEEGRDIGDSAVLMDIGARHGLERMEMEAAFLDGPLNAEIERREREAQRIGVQGVPFFIINGRYAVSGAQAPAMWAEALPQMIAELAKDA
jgi:predicted DsbA family dithiol-disulfide isomerase